jgi:hypothetical protein
MSDQENNHAAEPVENQDNLSEQPDDALLRPETDDAGEALAEDDAGVESLTSGADAWVEDPSAGLPEAVEAEAEPNRNPSRNRNPPRSRNPNPSPPAPPPRRN